MRTFTFLLVCLLWFSFFVSETGEFLLCFWSVCFLFVCETCEHSLYLRTLTLSCFYSKDGIPLMFTATMWVLFFLFLFFFLFLPFKKLRYTLKFTATVWICMCVCVWERVCAYVDVSLSRLCVCARACMHVLLFRGCACVFKKKEKEKKKKKKKGQY